MYRQQHPDETLLIDYADGALKSEDAWEVASHLRDCGRCAKQVEDYSAICAAVMAHAPCSSRRRVAQAIEVALSDRGYGTASRSRFRLTSPQVLRPSSRPFPTRPLLNPKWQLRVGLAAALTLGGLAGLWVTEQKPPMVNWVTTNNLTTLNDPDGNSSLVGKGPLSPEDERISRENAKEQQRRLKAIFPKGWDGERYVRVWPNATGSALDRIPLERLRWSTDAQGVYLASVLSGIFRHRPEVRKAYHNFGVQARLGSRNPHPHLSIQEWIDLDPRSRSIHGQNGYVLDPRVKRAFIFNFSARGLSLDEFLKRAAQSSPGCLVWRNGKQKWIRHAGIRIDKRDGIYYVGPGG